MPFTTDIPSGPVSAKGSKKNNSLKVELGILEQRLINYKEQDAEVVDLSGKIKEEKAKLVVAEKATVKEEARADAVNVAMNEEKAKANIKLVRVKQKIEDGENLLVGLQKDADFKQDTFDEAVLKSTEKANKEEARAEKALAICKDVEKEITKMKEELARVIKDLEDMKDEKGKIKGLLQDARDQLEVKLAEIERTENAVASNKNRVKELDQEILVKYKKIEEYNVEIAKKQKAFNVVEKKLFDVEKKAELMELSLATREGNISDKTTLLKEKEDALRTVKRELEKHYNRKINHIII